MNSFNGMATTLRVGNIFDQRASKALGNPCREPAPCSLSPGGRTRVQCPSLDTPLCHLFRGPWSLPERRIVTGGRSMCCSCCREWPPADLGSPGPSRHLHPHLNVFPHEDLVWTPRFLITVPVLGPYVTLITL